MWSIAKGEADSLFPQLLIAHNDIPSRIEQPHQLNIGSCNVHKLFTVRHFPHLVAQHETTFSQINRY